MLAALETPIGKSGPAGKWLVIALFWLLALGCAGLTAANFHAIAVAADRVEELYRLAPENQVGRGACAAFAKTQPPVMFDPDSECWINLTQAQARDGTVRPHDFPFDNTPDGRERHWSSSFSWWLLLLGAIIHAAGGAPMAAAIATAAAWANPVLFAGFLTVLAMALCRRIGAWQAGAFVLTLATMTGVEWDFSYGRPDHHGLHLMAFLGLFLGAMIAGMGWVRTDAPSRRRARFWFTVSGLCGGAGLWIGSTQQCVCIAVLGMGGVLGALICGNSQEGESRFDPGLWRHWSRVGAVTGLAFYLIEYFPHHMGMRLEVNHPLMAMGWAGGGELMWVITQARVDWAGARGRSREMLARLAVGFAAIGALPLAIIFGPKGWFVVRDPMFRYAAAIISEGKPWLDPRHPALAWGEIWNYTGVLWLAMPLAAGVLIWQGQLAPARRTALVTMLLASGVFLVWTLAQSRWMGFFEGSLALLALAVAPCLPIGGGRWAAVPLAWLALALPGWLGFAVGQWRTHGESPERHAMASLRGMMSAKEAAWNLRLQARGDRPARVMTSPGQSPTIHYYGGGDTVGSYYWENIRGCRAAIDFYTDTGEADARRIARERGLDFVVAVANPAFVLEMQTLKTGHVDVAAARRLLVFRLANPDGSGVPAWLEPLPLLDAPLARADGFRLYRVLRDRL